MTRRNLFIAIVIILAAFLTTIAAVPSLATEPTRCGTWHLTYTGKDVLVHDYTLDDGLRWSTVGHYLWLQNTAEGHSSTEHLTSVGLDVGEWRITACTDDTTNAAEIATTVAVDTPPGDTLPRVTATVVVTRRHIPL